MSIRPAFQATTGRDVSTEDIEACYRQSSYVKEICVVGLRHDEDSTTESLFAVVVPDMELLRKRRIVNVGDLLRFEMEGQSIHLPPHQRVSGYDVWFELLPRTTTGKVERDEIERRLRQKQQAAVWASVERPLAKNHWIDDHSAAAAAVIAAHVKDVAIQPESNLEIDLDLDSLDRVELLVALEQRFGVRIPEEQSHDILTVAQLIEAVRPGARAAGEYAVEDSWTMILRDLPAADDSELKSLLQRRPIVAPVLFVLLWALRALMPRVHVTGVEQLPENGPYIISPNHQSYLDPCVICGGLPYDVFSKVFFVGAAEYFETPIMRWLAKRANLVPVDPDANLVPAMQAAAFGLAHGKALMLFPEGERSIDGMVKRFKKGALILSRQMRVPIVPVAIRGVYELWPRNRGINWRTLMPWSGHRIHIAFGAPVQFDDSIGYAEAATQLRDRVDTMWNRLI